MIVVDLLLAANLALFAVLALRGQRSAQHPIDELIGLTLVPARVEAEIPAETVGNVVPFRAQGQLHLSRARALHPSSRP